MKQNGVICDMQKSVEHFQTNAIEYIKWWKFWKMTTAGAREQKSKKGRYVALDKLISFYLNQKYLKSVVSKFQNPRFKKSVT